MRYWPLCCFPFDAGAGMSLTPLLLVTVPRGVCTVTVSVAGMALRVA